MGQGPQAPRLQPARQLALPWTVPYPPAFLKFMEGRQDFAQLEDFNSANAKSAEAEEYQRKYHASMAGRQAGGSQARSQLEPHRAARRQ